ncbi:MAG: carbon storage regulator [Planctomycetaceae bacterium]|nr:carbon storage regulator [Planctomycetales bacterium]MCB9924154.1 carbon storage regulator [Planctomycetaceae bacterium]
MLVLGRKVGDEIVIGEDIRLVVVSIRGNQVRLGFDAPRDVAVRRREILFRSSHLVDPPTLGVLAEETLDNRETLVS